MRLRFGLVLALATLALGSRADAGWRTTRGDVRRTALVEATGELTTPAVRWRYYLGGYADARSFQAITAGRAGPDDLIFLAASGRVEARRPDDLVAWRSPLTGAAEILGVTDLDGDGKLEVVAVNRNAGRVLVHDAATGALRWSSPAGRYNQVQVASLRDLDGDGVDDLYVSAWGSFAHVGPQVADAWRFVGGATRLWTIDLVARDYDRGENDAWADVDGDGRRELVALGDRTVYVYSSVDGSLLASGDVGYVPAAQAKTIVADLDRDGRDEILLFSNLYYDAVRNRRHVTVLDVKNGAVVVRWAHGVDDIINDQHAFVGESVADVDGDGTLEVISSFFHAGAWMTYVHDGATGAVRASMPGVVVGALDVDGDGAAEVATQPAPDQRGVGVWDVTGTTATLRWQRPEAVWLTESDPATVQQQSLSARTLSLDVDGDGAREVVVGKLVGANQWRLLAYDLREPEPAIKRMYTLPDGVTLLAVQRAQVAGVDHLLAARSDGYLAVLDHDLIATNASVYPSGVVPGIKLGGYTTGWRGINATGMTADLVGDPAEDILVRDSRLGLDALDPSGATMTVPPRKVWDALGLRWHPALVDTDGDGRLEVITGDVGHATLLDGATGATRWTAPVASDPYGTASGIDLDGDGAEEIGYLTFDPATGEQVLGALSGAGAPRWPAPIRRKSSGCGRGHYSFADLTGDRVPDAAAQIGCRLVTVDGGTGAVLGDINNSGPLSNAPILADVDGSDHLAIVANGFGGAYYTYDLAGGVAAVRGSVANTGASEVSYYDYGTLVQCPSGPRYFFSVQNSSHLRAIDPSHLTAVLDAYLAGGVVYPTRDELPTGGIGTAFIGNVNAVSNLTGDGEPRLLVGSTDGYLYALHACAADPAGLLDWRLPFDAPVGEPIPADIDGDGKTELVVSVADGYLYAIDREPTPSPLHLAEVGADGLDLDDVDLASGLALAWDAAPGAVGYEVGIFDALGGAVLSPAFRAVGAATAVTLTDVPLRAGARYDSVVRAVSADGARSFERLSDGFHVRADAVPPPPGDLTSGCGCQSSGSPTAALPLLVVLPLLRRRRSATRSACRAW